MSTPEGRNFGLGNFPPDSLGFGSHVMPEGFAQDHTLHDRGDQGFLIVNASYDETGLSVVEQPLDDSGERLLAAWVATLHDWGRNSPTQERLAGLMRRVDARRNSERADSESTASESQSPQEQGEK
ncbi:MAG: hypothetical protein ABWX94_00065 [Candidatus Saccharimonadales bacterium]